MSHAETAFSSKWSVNEDKGKGGAGLEQQALTSVMVSYLLQSILGQVVSEKKNILHILKIIYNPHTKTPWGTHALFSFL